MWIIVFPPDLDHMVPSGGDTPVRSACRAHLIKDGGAVAGRFGDRVASRGVDAEKRARDEAIAGRAAAAERQRLAERARAQRLINEFIAAMRERGVPPVKLRARVADGRATYRTRHQGWYIRRNKALAVGVNGEFLILDVPASLRSRVSGADVVPSEPPLVIGRGARDGESIDLADLLRLALTESP